MTFVVIGALRDKYHPGQFVAEISDYFCIVDK